AVFVRAPAIRGTNDEVRVDLSEDQYRRYCLWLKEYVPIQKLLGDLSRRNREKLITGFDNDEFDSPLVAPVDRPKSFDDEHPIELSGDGIVWQAKKAAHDYLVAGIADIDKLFGEGTARAHPELVTAYAQIAAIDASATIVAQQVRAGIETVAEAIGAYYADL